MRAYVLNRLGRTQARDEAIREMDRVAARLDEAAAGQVAKAPRTSRGLSQFSSDENGTVPLGRTSSGLSQFSSACPNGQAENGTVPRRMSRRARIALPDGLSISLPQRAGHAERTGAAGHSGPVRARPPRPHSRAEVEVAFRYEPRGPGRFHGGGPRAAARRRPARHGLRSGQGDRQAALAIGRRVAAAAGSARQSQRRFGIQHGATGCRDCAEGSGRRRRPVLRLHGNRGLLPIARRRPAALAGRYRRRRAPRPSPAAIVALRPSAGMFLDEGNLLCFDANTCTLSRIDPATGKIVFQRTLPSAPPAPPIPTPVCHRGSPAYSAAGRASAGGG